MPSSSQILSFWQQALAALVRGEGQDLTVRQLAILTTIYASSAPCTVRGLASGLAISKPAVTRAIDTLETLELCRRQPDESDRRSVLIQRTVRGSVYAARLGDVVRAALPVERV
ncbi:MAG: MarR family transcriptional regulator [Proteobacteria bacterium]|nr:MarR family transcriptional regulator [Pseudomonadota bacterium]MDA1058511.1 MarR family transcriptional regulator [Pseudomonadota bacterium]